MEAPWVRNCSKPSQVKFEQQPPRLVRWGFHASPLESLLLGITDDGAVCRMEFARGRDAAQIVEDWIEAWPDTKFVQEEKATGEIFKIILGKSKAALKLQMTGTKFQIKVWKELLKVPPGETISYAELARRIRKPKAMRAVGNAMGANVITLIIPCHRVISTGGGIGGFGGSLDLKRMLLRAECKEAA